MSRNAKKRFIYIFPLSLIIIAAIVVVIIYLRNDTLPTKYEEQINALQQELFSYETDVFVPKTDIRAGETLTLDNVIKISVISDLPLDVYFSERDLGKIALINLTANVPIMKVMCMATELPYGLREFECNKLTMNSNLISNDYVDVKIVFPNSEDYTVLAKVPIKNVDQASGNCFFWLTEEQIILITSAILDAEQIPGTKLYTTKYIRPTVQEASTVDYPMNQYALDLLRYTPNSDYTLSIAISEDRLALEERIKEFLGLEQFGTTANWGTSAPAEGDSSLDPDNTDTNEEPAGEDAFVVEFGTDKSQSEVTDIVDTEGR